MCMWCRGGITTEGVSMAAMLKTEEGFVETTRFPRMIVSGLVAWHLGKYCLNPARRADGSAPGVGRVVNKPGTGRVTS